MNNSNKSQSEIVTTLYRPARVFYLYASGFVGITIDNPNIAGALFVFGATLRVG